MAGVRAVCTMLAAINPVDLDELIGDAESFDAFGPYFHTDAWMHQGDNIRANATVLKRLREFKRTIDPLAPETLRSRS